MNLPRIGTYSVDVFSLARDQSSFEFFNYLILSPDLQRQRVGDRIEFFYVNRFGQHRTVAFLQATAIDYSTGG